MRLQRIEQLLAGILLVVFGGIVLHAPLTVWKSTLLPDYTLLIKSWKELLMLLAVPLAVYLVSKKGLWRQFARDRLFQLIVAYAGLHIILLPLFWVGFPQALAGLAIDLRYVLYFGLVYTLIRVTPGYRNLFVKVGIAGALTVVVFALLQVFVLPKDILANIGYQKNVTIAPYLTVDENPDYVRINSTLRGPNPLGAYAVIVLSLLIAFWLKGNNKEFKRPMGVAITLLVGGSVALWASYSRSAMLALVIALGIIIFITLGRKLRRAYWVGLTILIGAVMGGLFLAKDTSFISNVLLHENATTGANISSNEGHIDSLQDGLNRLVQRPIGGGVGSTGSASLYGDNSLIIENQYLFVAHETGWLGLGLFLLLSLTVLARLWVKKSDYLALGLFASGVGLFVVGLFLPVWVDDTVSIVWWGLAGAILGSSDGKKRTSK